MGEKKALRLGWCYSCSSIAAGMVAAVVILCLGSLPVSVGEEDSHPPTSNQNQESHVAQVRYRTRPVAAFRNSKASGGNSTNNSSDVEGAGVPFIAVHELTSQTLEKLQENWKNLEAIIRNLPARRSQEESLRASANAGRDTANIRRPSTYSANNNFYTFKYHPSVLEEERSSSNIADDVSNTGRAGLNPSRATTTLNGNYHFNPFPYDPRGQGSKDVDMERHTLATIYTIGICLAIMAIGSVMFILINKCDGTSGGSNYVRTAAVPAGTGGGSNTNRITRGVLGAASRTGRSVSNNNNGRNRGNNRPGGRSSNENENNNGNVQSLASSANHLPAYESDAKVLTDLPPSYDSLFPEGGPSKPQEALQLQQESTGSTVTTNTVSSSDNTQNGSSPIVES